MFNLERAFIIGLLLLVGSLFVQSLDLPMFMNNGLMAAGFLPRVLSIFLICLLIFYFIKTIYDKQNNEKGDEVPKGAAFKQIFFIASLAVSIFLVKLIGIILTMGVFVLITLMIVEKISFFRAVLFSLACMLCVYFIFVFLLGIVLPKGTLL